MKEQLSNYKPIITTYISIIALFLSAGCNDIYFFCQSDKPKELIDNFISYQTYSEFEQKLKSRHDTIIVIENFRVPKEDTRPGISTYTVLIPNFKMENVKGKLRASFYNDRLMSICYYPENISVIEKLIKSNYDITLSINESIINDCVKVYKSKDMEGNVYFEWSDLKLINDKYSWISKYA